MNEPCVLLVPNGFFLPLPDNQVDEVFQMRFKSYFVLGQILTILTELGCVISCYNEFHFLKSNFIEHKNIILMSDAVATLNKNKNLFIEDIPNSWLYCFTNSFKLWTRVSLSHRHDVVTKCISVITRCFTKRLQLRPLKNLFCVGFERPLYIRGMFIWFFYEVTF